MLVFVSLDIHVIQRYRKIVLRNVEFRSLPQHQRNFVELQDLDLDLGLLLLVLKVLLKLVSEVASAWFTVWMTAAHRAIFRAVSLVRMSTSFA